MTDTDALRELLERAIELEEKAVDVLGREVTVDAQEDLAAQAELLGADDEVVVELTGRLAALNETLTAAAGEALASEGLGDDTEDTQKGWAEDLEAKAYGPCSKCGSTDVNEFADGRAECDDCGAPLSEAKDFDDLDDGIDLDLEAKAALDDEVAAWLDDNPEPAGEPVEAAEVKSGVLTEFELLRAKRAELGV